eukprot:TRINITY_DN18494_c0_g4_i1.p1 TRINITY_DN18494_c0_g4~~TRINITY_DN18494_c0_g4_i1.p1  ORF type:complete len:102 (+),score=12.70 TRINITY_DN18494_c0_g4_i1:1056-1361(+)
MMDDNLVVGIQSEEIIQCSSSALPCENLTGLPIHPAFKLFCTDLSFNSSHLFFHHPSKEIQCHLHSNTFTIQNHSILQPLPILDSADLSSSRILHEIVNRH